MKQSGNHFLVVIFTFLFIQSCSEIGPDINLGGNKNSFSDTTYIEIPVATTEAKNVVIEEFTGVRCPNCPQGHIAIVNIKAANPNRVISVSLHPINSLGYAYPFSTQNFTSTKAQSLFDYIGQVGFEPVAAIDRILFSGQTKILLDKSLWSNYVTQQLTQASPANITLNKNFNSSTNELTIIVEVHYTQAVIEANKLTVLLTESNMVSAQLDGAEIDTFYTHNDVMRDFISDTQGDAITPTREAGRVIRKVYKKILDSAWNPENMHIVAYLHEFANANIVYQGREISVVD